MVNMKGNYPYDYFKNPIIYKPINEIYADIDAFSMEVFPDEITKKSRVDMMIVLPPLNYEGIVTKGIFLSQGTDYIYECYPDIGQIFHSCAFSMWSSYPWSKKADAYCVCYDNPQREEWFKKTNPDRADKILLPVQDADFTNEYFMAPTFNTPKEIDVFCIGRLSELKNLNIFARALKIYHKKYGRKLTATLVTGGEPNTSLEKKEMQLIEEELGTVDDYLKIIPHVPHKDLPKHYTGSKLCVLPSLFEGKNRVIQEAASCNTGIVAFRDFNKYSRGEHPIFWGNEEGGFLVPDFTAESLCDTIYWGLMNYEYLKPRKHYLMNTGRKNLINKIVDMIPYYKENLPGYVPNKIQENLWVDLAMQDNYQISFMDFLYGKNCAIQHITLLENNNSLMHFFYSRFGIEKSKPFVEFDKLPE